jgi:hypothetical protein
LKGRLGERAYILACMWSVRSMDFAVDLQRLCLQNVPSNESRPSESKPEGRSEMKQPLCFCVGLPVTCFYVASCWQQMLGACLVSVGSSPQPPRQTCGWPQSYSPVRPQRRWLGRTYRLAPYHARL